MRAGQRQRIPILGCCRLTADGNLRIHGRDLDTGIEAIADCSVIEPGEACVTDDTPEDAFLSEEARTDAAGVEAELPYAPRRAWKPGLCVGYIINTERPVAKVTSPKKRGAKKEFFERLNKALANLS